MSFRSILAIALTSLLTVGVASAESKLVPQKAQGVWAPNGNCKGDTVTITSNSLTYKGGKPSPIYFQESETPAGNGVIHYSEEGYVDNFEYVKNQDYYIYNSEGPVLDNEFYTKDANKYNTPSIMDAYGEPEKVMLNGRIPAWGPYLFLKDAAAAYTHTAPNKTKVIQSVDMILVHLDYEPRWVRSLNSDKKITHCAPVGAVDIVPKNSDAFASWSQTKRSLRLDIHSRRLELLAGLEFDNDCFELQPPNIGLVDNKSHIFASLIQSELMHSFINPEMVDHLITAFSIHILRNYSSAIKAPNHIRNGGLSPFAFRRIEEFIMENINQNINIEQLAAIAGMSPSHFIRSFKKSTGQPPHKFLISTRLTYARKLIVDTNLNLKSIAELAGFSSQSHLSYQMKRTWGTTPLSIRKL